MLKQVALALAVAAITVAPSACAQQTPPSSEHARRIKAMVNEVAALVEIQGSAAFFEFRKQNSE